MYLELTLYVKRQIVIDLYMGGTIVYAWATPCAVMVGVTAERDLAETLKTWIDRQRIPIAAIARNGDLSRNVIYAVMNGSAPESDTLRKLARGLSVDPRTEVRDESVEAEVLADLMDASGRGSEEPCSASQRSLEDHISPLVKSRAKAEAFATILRRYPTLSRGERKLIDGILETMGDEQSGR